MAARTSFFVSMQMAVALFLLVTCFMKADAQGPTCDTVYGVKDGDTCFGIIQGMKLTEPDFFGINPNINCQKIFVGQWVCVSGNAN